MSYKLRFLVEADKEWRKHDANTRKQFKKKLLERLETARIASAKPEWKRHVEPDHPAAV